TADASSSTATAVEQPIQSSSAVFYPTASSNGTSAANGYSTFVTLAKPTGVMPTGYGYAW
ncbi:hypothetical protein LTR16_006445, partial [Cryomyces antarcticus]